MEKLSQIVKTTNMIAFGNTIRVNMDRVVARRCATDLKLIEMVTFKELNITYIRFGWKKFLLIYIYI